MEKLKINHIKTAPLKQKEVLLWRMLHAKDDGMMYPLPEKNSTLWKRLKGANAHLVRDQDGTLVGCFSVSIQADGIATGGTAVRNGFRARGIGSQILAVQEDMARSLGAHSFRCDVFSDNAAGVALMTKNGYRNFQWFEKPLITKIKKKQEKMNKANTSNKKEKSMTKQIKISDESMKKRFTLSEIASSSYIDRCNIKDVQELEQLLQRVTPNLRVTNGYIDEKTSTTAIIYTMKELAIVHKETASPEEHMSDEDAWLWANCDIVFGGFAPVN